MFTVGQILSQVITKGELNSARKVADYLFWGTINPIAAHSWQNFLAKKGPGNFFVKIVFDHFSYRACMLVVFHFYCKLQEGCSISKSLEWIRSNSLPLHVTAFKLWPTVNIINYYMVPLKFRVLYANVVLFFWVLYLAITDSIVSESQ
jgi:protein Mpv17